METLRPFAVVERLAARVYSLSFGYGRLVIG
jgi:hypothetical protein